MKRNLLVVLSLWVVCAPAGAAQSGTLQKVEQLEQTGHFREAGDLIAASLKGKTPSPADRKQLEFELDRLERIRKDFPYTRDALFAELQKAVKDLTSAEYDQWIREGRFDSREIDGRRFFMGSSVSNLYFRYAELEPRRLPVRDKGEFERSVLKNCEDIAEAAKAAKKPYVLPKRFHVTMTVKAKPTAAPDGEILRAWLPIPRRYPFQGDFVMLQTSSPVKHIGAETEPLRAVFMEQPARTNAPTSFQIVYDYTIHGVKFDVKPEEVHASEKPDPDLLAFVQESPHVVFTPEIRALSREIAGNETNPAVKAKKFYDWIAEHIKYSYAIEYSTIRNISDYCRTKGYGDCGQEALLFITLCRLNGIPARWQSGWNTVSGGKTIHDWSEIYLAPYGWMPVDPYMGIYATRYITTLKPEQKKEISDFYFGGLDQYRMAANSDHNQPLSPSKRSMRSDDVDFQRGELEWGDHNIYFDQYSWDLSWQEVKLPAVE